MVETGAGQTLVRVIGPESAPPLVLLPAAKLHSLMWLDDIEHYAQHFRTYTVDAIYDNGRSVSAHPITTVESAVAWLDGLHDALGLRDGVFLMGASLGAWLAAEYVLYAPDRLAKAVWAAPPGVVVGASWRWITRAMLTVVPSPGALRSFMDWTCPVAAGSAGRTKAIYDRAVDDIVLGGKCFRTRPFPGGPRVFTDAELAGIRVPVLYIEGEHERICSPQAAVARLSALAPETETTVFPGVDHSLTWVAPEAVNERALQFLLA